MRAAFLVFYIVVAQLSLAGPRHFPATGLVLEVDQQSQTFTVSHQNIPGLMEAMSMPFHVKKRAILDGIRPGHTVTFTLTVGAKSSWVDEIRVIHFESPDRDPVQADRLKVMDEVTAGRRTSLAIGEKANFGLIDQDGRSFELATLAGKVVVIDFIYTRCPLPDYCFRLSNNFGRLQKRFANNPDLALLTVTFDPVHDGPEELSRYARIWNADPQKWRFLTGTTYEIRRVCDLFGVGYWQDEGVITHSLHTAILDREGKLAANLEGNKFTAKQLGDLADVVIKKKVITKRR